MPITCLMQMLLRSRCGSLLAHADNSTRSDACSANPGKLETQWSPCIDQQGALVGVNLWGASLFRAAQVWRALLRLVS
jgi:hypothetical protein